MKDYSKRIKQLNKQDKERNERRGEVLASILFVVGIVLIILIGSILQ